MCVRGRQGPSGHIITESDMACSNMHPKLPAPLHFLFL